MPAEGPAATATAVPAPGGRSAADKARLKRWRRVSHLAVWALTLTPAAVTLAHAFTNRLGVNPIETLTDRTGWWAIFHLVLTLAVTPLRRLTGRHWLVRYRRQLGLGAFVYASLHLGVYAVLDLGLDLSHLGEDILERPFVTVGFTAWLILLALAFVAGPMLATVAAGLRADLLRLAGEEAVRRATLTSVVLALLSALLAAVLSLSLAMGRRALMLERRRRPVLEFLTGSGTSFVLVIPPIVIGAGWFLLLRHFSDVFAIAPVMVVTVNAVMAMPFALRAVQPAYDAASERHERLCAQLGISGWTRLSLVDWPGLRRPLATAFAFAMALSLGDLGVIALFGTQDFQTLPLMMFRALGSYRGNDAASIAAILLIGTIIAFVGLPRLFERIADAAC